jgi:hypothetical protein
MTNALWTVRRPGELELQGRFYASESGSPTTALSGCGVAYEQERSGILKTASIQSFGPPPPDNYREVGADLIRKQLKDPDSAKFEWVGEPKKDAIQPAFASPHAIPVWLTEVGVNAKNSFGGYTGSQLWMLAWQNGKIIAFASPDTTGGTPGF